MSKILLSLTMCAFILLPTFNKAHAVDMASLTCKEVVAYPADKINMVIVWFDGYLSFHSDNSVLNQEWINVLSTHMGEYCTKNPTEPIMNALESLPETEVSGGEDILKLKCANFLETKEDIARGILWIDGYMSAGSENTSMDATWLEKLGTHLTTYCAANKTKTIEEAMEAMEE